MNAIPAELRARPQWVLWRSEERDGKPTKVPYCAADPTQRASSTDRATWSTFEQAVAARSQADGIGFVFSSDDPYVGVDLDDCVDSAGFVHPEADAIVRELASYTERSPSGTGAHVFVRAQLNGSRRRTSKTAWGGEFEVYDAGRYFTITGDRLESVPETVEARQAEVEAVIAKILPPVVTNGAAAATRPQPPLELDDHELLERASNAKNGATFLRLWRGDLSGYGSASEADLALCNLLAFWTGPDPAHIDGLFRQSGLMRDKWDEPRGEETYGAQTIGRALEGRTDYYTPERPVQLPSPPASDGATSSAPAPRRFDEWPTPLDEAAFYGLAGDFVRTIEPHSEADPAALLIQLLVAVGNACGRGPGFLVEGDFHPTNLYAVLVGPSSSGRKGTSWGRVRQVLEHADPTWTAERLSEGLSSGEGLIHAVRDPVVEEPDDEDAEEKTIDPGVPDKRLMVQEPELARALRAMDRDGNTLSGVIRSLWDRGTSQTMVRHSPQRATRAHVSIIGHITRDELRRDLTATDTANGFANRFLFVCAKRSKSLPHGGNLHPRRLEELGYDIRQVLQFASVQEVMPRDAEARELWGEVYEGLVGEDRRGLFGAATSRAAAQVVRLSVIYAVLDMSAEIRRSHLEVALAVWDYCQRSAQHVFGTALGDKVADSVLSHLREAGDLGLTRTDLNQKVRKDASELDRATTLLEEHGLAHRRTLETGGRPAERWYAR